MIVDCLLDGRYEIIINGGTPTIIAVIRANAATFVDTYATNLKSVKTLNGSLTVRYLGP